MSEVATDKVERRSIVVTPATLADLAKSRAPAEAKKTEETKPEARAEESDDPDHEVKKASNGIQKRFSELTSQRKEAEAKAAESERKALDAERRARELEAKLNPPRPDDPGPEPDPGDFKDLDGFRKALKDWASNAKEAEIKRAARDIEQKEHVDSIKKRWLEETPKVRAEVPDFDDVVSHAQVELPQDMLEAIVESEHGPRLQYYLAKNMDETRRLMGMSPKAMLKGLGKIEARIDDQIEAKRRKETKQEELAVREASGTRRAPEPITPIKQSSAAAVDVPRDAKGSFAGTFEEYKALRKARKI